MGSYASVTKRMTSFDESNLKPYFLEKTYSSSNIDKWYI